MRTLISVLFLLFASSFYASDMTDSLENRLKDVQGVEKVDVLVDLTYFYASESFEKAYNYGVEALSCANKLNYTEGIIESYINLAIAYIYQSSYDKAEQYFIMALKLSRDHKNFKLEARILNGLGVVCKSKGDFAGALKYYQDAIKYFSDTTDGEDVYRKRKGEAVVRNNMGNIYKNWGKLDEAKKQFMASINILSKLDDKKELSKSISNLGLLLIEEKDYKGALDKYKESLKIEIELNDSAGIARCYNNMGECYLFMKDYKNSKSFLKKSMDIAVGYNLVQQMLLSQSSLADLYAELNDEIRAIAYLESSLTIANPESFLTERKNIYRSLFEVYKRFDKPGKALESYIQYTALKDSIFSRENEDKLIELQTVYETEKKDAEIKIKNAQLEKEKQISERQRFINLIAIGVLAIVALFSIALFFQVRAKKKANKVLRLKNEEISQQKEEIESQRDEIETQRDQVQKQKEKIETINKEITSSIEYAQQIQSALLPSKQIISEVFSESFVFFQPKDIVSGDFYWLREQGQQVIIAAADCTGHGVPGGFMSMLGISLLNEIVDQAKIYQPDLILNRLREQVIKALGRSGQDKKLGDGMDISVCTINKKTKELQYSGANNSIYIIPGPGRNLESILKDKYYHFTHSEKQLMEIKADKMPVGRHVRQDQDFTLHEVALQTGDLVVLFSDGYVDQFGGPDEKKGGRKLMHKAFKNLLLDNADKPLEDIDKSVAAYFEFWKGTFEQTDDVLVMGIRV